MAAFGSYKYPVTKGAKEVPSGLPLAWSLTALAVHTVIPAE